MASKISRKILYMYAENCRTPFSKIAKKVKRSPQLVKYTINSFEKNSTIPFYYSVIDYAYFGQLLFKVYFKGGCSRPSDVNLLLKKLIRNTNIVSIYEIGDQYDLLIEFMATNPSRFNKQLKQLIHENSELKNYDTIVNVVSHLYPRKYLMPSRAKISGISPYSDIVVGGDREMMQLSRHEKTVLNHILINPKAKPARIAASLGINVKTAISSIKSLEAKKILRACRAELDLQGTGIIKNKIVLKLHNIDVKAEEKLLRYCADSPFIVGVSKTIGSWDVEIDIETMAANDFRQAYLEIRENFREVINSFNSFRVYRSFKRQFLPENIFS